MIFFKPLTTKEEWNWLDQRAMPLACQDAQGLVAYNEKGTIQAVASFDSWTPDSCSVHLAIANPFVIRHGFLHEIARHLFIVCDRKFIFGIVPSNNPKALKLDLHIGFYEVARIPDGYREGVDYIILRMDKATCPWLAEELRKVA